MSHKGLNSKFGIGPLGMDYVFTGKSHPATYHYTEPRQDISTESIGMPLVLRQGLLQFYSEM